MARCNFDEQIKIFLKENRHLGARYREEETNGNVDFVAVVCDELEGLIIPDGMHLEEKDGCYWLENVDTGEFLKVIPIEKEMDFFGKV